MFQVSQRRRHAQPSGTKALGKRSIPDRPGALHRDLVEEQR
jgi:hypothetical protein